MFAARPTLGLEGSPVSTKEIYLHHKLATPLGSHPSLLIVFHFMVCVNFCRITLSLWFFLLFLFYYFGSILKQFVLVLRFENCYFFLEILDQRLLFSDSGTEQNKLSQNNSIVPCHGVWCQLGNHVIHVREDYGFSWIITCVSCPHNFYLLACFCLFSLARKLH